MLRLIIYDIADPKRLQKVAKTCEDYGARVQFSVFECWLEDDGFEQLWGRIEELLDPEQDKVAAYTLDKATAKARRILGETMEVTQKRQFYLF